MSKSKIFLTIGWTMIFLAILFIFYAMHHPECSFVWSKKVTDMLYTFYVIVIIVMFVLSDATKEKKERNS